MHTKKSISSSGRQRAHEAIAPNIHFLDCFCTFCSSGSTWRPPQACLHFENKQNRIGFIHVCDALTAFMLDPRRVTQNQKMSATLHGNAPAQNRTSATLHGNAFRIFRVQSGASKKVPPKCARPLFLNGCLMLFDPTDTEVTHSRRRAILAPCCVRTRFLKKRSKRHH